MRIKAKENSDVLTVTAIFVIAIAVSLVTDISMLYALVPGAAGYAALAMRRGYSLKSVIVMARRGAGMSLGVVATLLVIGAVSASWRAGGTIAMFVHYGMDLITPHIFILLSFVLCCVFAYALGSCLGVAGTIGTILVTIARAGDASVLLTAGAVISGGFLGTRISPMSSSVNLTAMITGTDVYKNLKPKSIAVPLIITTALYAVCSYAFPISAVDPEIEKLMEENFIFSPVLLLPAGLMLVLPLFKIDVKIVGVISALTAAGMAVFFQDMPPAEAVLALVRGYEPGDPGLEAVFAGGGIVSMAETSLIVMVSCAYSEIIKETGMFRDLIKLTAAGSKKVGSAGMTMLTGTVFSGLFCSQSVAIIMNGNVMASVYRAEGKSREEMAADIENTTICSSGWIPWSTAGLPAFEAMAVSSACLPCAFFVFVMPVYYLLSRRVSARHAARHAA